MRRNPALTELELLMLSTKTKGVGEFAVRISERPKSTRRRPHYIVIISATQWDNMLLRVRLGQTQIYGIHPIINDTIRHSPIKLTD